jgi:hypothetical protein
MSADIIMFVPRPNPSPFTQSYNQVRKELLDLIPYARSGGPILTGPGGIDDLLYESSVGFVEPDKPA